MNPTDLQKSIDSLKAEAIEQIKAIETKSDAATAKIAEIETLYKAEFKRVEDALKSKQNGSLPGSEGDSKNKFSFTKALRVVAFGEHDERSKDCGYEKEVMSQAVNKAGQYATAGIAGGFFIPTELASIVVALAHAKMPLFDLKPTILSGLTSNITIPRVTARGVGYSVGENAVPGPAGTATMSTNTFGAINLVPKRIAAYNKISNLLLLQAPAVAEKVIMDELSLMVALKYHSNLLYGKGNEYEQKGVFSHALTASTAIGASGGRYTLDHAQIAQADVDNRDLLLDTGNFAYVMHPLVKQGLKRERVAFTSGTSSVGNQGFPVYGLYQGMMNDKAVEDRIGYPIRSTTQIVKTNTKGSSTSCSDVIFGDWTQLLIAEWAGLTIKKTDVASDTNSSAWLNDESWILLQLQADCALKNEGAFAYVSDAETSSTLW